jgi:hypothetical protein
VHHNLPAGPTRGQPWQRAGRSGGATLLQLRPTQPAAKSTSSGRFLAEAFLGHPLAQPHLKELPKLLEKLCKTDLNFDI